MKLLPVLDIRHGVVVRGVAGERDSYRPVESRIVDSASVLPVANAFREHFGLTELYVADLDAILDERPNFDAYRNLADAGFTLLIDAGLRDAESAMALFDRGASAVIAGLETLRGPESLERLIGEFGADRVIFSLDLHDGRPLGDAEAWGNDAHEIARRAIAMGARRLIVLDLARVGVAAGISTLELCRRLRGGFPELELTTGGGVRGVDDLRRLRDESIDAVLVASALHDGSLSIEHVRQAGRRQPPEIVDD